MRRSNLMVSSCAVLLAVAVSAEDTLQPTVSVTAGQLLVNKDRDNVVQTEVTLPVYVAPPLSLRYRYRDTTTFYAENSQAELLYTRYELQADVRLTGNLGLIVVGGYRRTAFEDQPGSLGAGALGAGLGTLPGREPQTLEWHATAGGFVARQDLTANWWLDADAAWRIHTFDEQQTLDTKWRYSVGLAGKLELVGEDHKARGHYQVGPFVDFHTAHGNRARVAVSWYYADGHPFYADRESALMASVQVNSSFDQAAIFNARDQRPRGWLPLVWGAYDLGWGGDRTLQRTELNAEVQDIFFGHQRLTGFIWYEPRQEFRSGDYDNISYSVSAGLKTEIGLASIVSQGQPLVVGLDYLHRSAHALDPDASRVPPGTFVARNSINVGPRLKLQTLGWDLPYRDPAIYKGEARWLHHFDWRLTIGYDFNSSRNREQPAAQAGLHWDIAAFRACVAYARAIGSIGNETPDWHFEAGIRRQTGNVFLRAERYGLESRLARGNLLVAGIGFYL